MIIDSHIHLTHFQFENEFPYLAYDNGEFEIRRGTRLRVIEEIRSAGTAACVEPAIDIESNQRILDLSKKYPGFIYPAVGVHPTRTYVYPAHDEKAGKIVIKRLYLKDRKLVRGYAADPSVIAVGETGLDYHLQRKEQHRIRQFIWFISQIRTADERGLPLILHIRCADRDALNVLRLFKKRLHGGVCHYFNGDAKLAGKYTALGFTIGIGGAILTNTPEAQAIKEAVKKTPLDMILLETDGPYVKPDCPQIPEKQVRKARNTSLILPAVAKCVAELKGVTQEEVEKKTAENAARIFGINDR